MLFTNKVVIITGGGRGIGKSIALRFVKENAYIVLADIDEYASAETINFINRKNKKKVRFLKTDVSDETQVLSMINEVYKDYGKIDVLVNNCGIAGPIKFAEEVTLEEWEKTLAVNLRSMFLCVKYTLPIMKKNNEGVIVNISSATGKRPLPMRLPYATSKMGVIGFTRTLAAEVGKYNIRVNAVCPGAVTGERQKVAFEGIMKYTGKNWDEVVEDKTEDTALKTLIDPNYIANAVAFLCSKEAAMITGEDINVTAGAIMY